MTVVLETCIGRQLLDWENYLWLGAPFRSNALFGSWNLCSTPILNIRTLYTPTVLKKTINRLQRVLNNALLVVFRTNRSTTVIDLHRRANIMSIKDRIQFNLLKYVHKQVQFANPLYPLVDSYATRSSEQRFIRLP